MEKPYIPEKQRKGPEGQQVKVKTEVRKSSSSDILHLDPGAQTRTDSCSKPFSTVTLKKEAKEKEHKIMLKGQSFPQSEKKRILRIDTV